MKGQPQMLKDKHSEQEANAQLDGIPYAERAILYYVCEFHKGSLKTRYQISDETTYEKVKFFLMQLGFHLLELRKHNAIRECKHGTLLVDYGEGEKRYEYCGETLQDLTMYTAAVHGLAIRKHQDFVLFCVVMQPFIMAARDWGIGCAGWRRGEEDRARRSKAGKATKRWNEKTEKLARNYFNQFKAAGLPDTAAYNRTVAKLKAEHNIRTSRSSLQRHLKTLPNAER